jgi:hypothetical protein
MPGIGNNNGGFDILPLVEDHVVHDNLASRREFGQTCGFLWTSRFQEIHNFSEFFSFCAIILFSLSICKCKVHKFIFFALYKSTNYTRINQVI